MLIRKTQQPASFPDNNIHDAYSTSTTDTYSCNYINSIVESVGNDYSTTEINTGQTWIDGKPIYRKIVKVNNLAIKDGTTYAHGIANIKEILPMSCGRMLYGNNTPFYTYPLVAHSGAILTSTFNTTNIVWVGNDSWGTSHTHIFVIYYTKTTD